MTYSKQIAANVRAEMGRYNKRTRDLEDALGLGTTAVRERLNGRVAFTSDELPTVARSIGVPLESLTRYVPGDPFQGAKA